MMSALAALGIVLLAIPVVCALIVLVYKIKESKRAKTIETVNATTTRTTVKKGANGRTVFEATTVKQSPPRSPVLPFTQQQASRASRPASMKNTWQRLSRPFSAAPAVYEDDEIELTQTQTQKQRPAPHSSRFKEHLSTALEGSISPVSPRRGSNASWNTIDALDSAPVSPVSMTGHQHQRYSLPQGHTNPYKADLPSNDSYSKNKTKKAKGGIDLGSARGFVVSTVKEQVLTDENKAKAKQAAMGIAHAAGHYAAGSIKKSVLDGKHKTTNVQLSAPPKARVAGTKR